MCDFKCAFCQKVSEVNLRQNVHLKSCMPDPSRKNLFICLNIKFRLGSGLHDTFECTFCYHKVRFAHLIGQNAHLVASHMHDPLTML